MLSRPPEFIPLSGIHGDRDEMFIKFLARCLLRSWKPSQPTLSYEHIENFTKDLEVRRDLENVLGQNGQPGLNCYEALKRSTVKVYLASLGQEIKRIVKEMSI